MITVNPVLKLDESWFIHSNDLTPQDIKVKFLNKEVSDGTDSIQVIGITFPERPFAWAHGEGYLVELIYKDHFEYFSDL